ncbi:hypothetical protein ATER59S_00551 [Aquamicrobium terrae]
MTIEDGDELPIHARFEESDGDPYWYCRLAALPHAGDTVTIDAAPQGVRHIVTRIDHHVGGASHRIVIVVARASRNRRSMEGNRSCTICFSPL